MHCREANPVKTRLIGLDKLAQIGLHRHDELDYTDTTNWTTSTRLIGLDRQAKSDYIGTIIC